MKAALDGVKLDGADADRRVLFLQLRGDAHFPVQPMGGMHET